MQVRAGHLPLTRDVVLAEARAKPKTYPNLDGVQSIQNADGRITLSHDNESGTIYYTVDGSDPANLDGTLTAAAIEYTGPISTGATATQLRSRVFDPQGTDPFQQWSASCPVRFYGGPGEAGLTINEIHYHPLSGDTDSAEFIEIANHGDLAIPLGSVRIEGGSPITCSTQTQSSNRASTSG